ALPIFLNRNYKVKAKKLFWAVFLDRVNGVLALFVLAMFMAPFLTLPSLYKTLAVVSIPASIAVYYLVIHFFFKDFNKGITRSSLLSLAVQLSQLIAAWFILYANHNQDNTIAYLFLFLVSSIVATLPITIGGIGSREITFLFGAEIMQLDVHQSIALSLLFYIITAIVSLGGIYFSLNETALKLEMSDNQPIKDIANN
ncbi:MAG: flippase-like domain-containing protein, partial [Lentimicrobium sp.]|nr:flippase-like domain-containing protein [Lentimicrobium sp.]